MPAAAATTRAASDWSSRWAIFGIARCDWPDLRADAWVGQVVLQMFLRKRTDPEPIQAYRSCIVVEGGRLDLSRTHYTHTILILNFNNTMSMQCAYYYQ